MVSTSVIGIAVISLIIGGYLNLYFHEYTHWVAGKLFSGGPNVLYDSYHKIPYPYAVEYERLTHMPNYGIRVAGISPHVVWTTAAAPYVFDGLSVIDTNLFLMINSIAEGIYSTPFLLLIFIAASFIAGLSVSPSDLVATFYPRRYRNYADRKLSHRESLHLLFGKLE